MPFPLNAVSTLILYDPRCRLKIYASIWIRPLLITFLNYSPSCDKTRSFLIRIKDLNERIRSLLVELIVNGLIATRAPPPPPHILGE